MGRWGPRGARLRWFSRPSQKRRAPRGRVLSAVGPLPASPSLPRAATPRPAPQPSFRPSSASSPPPFPLSPPARGPHGAACGLHPAAAGRHALPPPSCGSETQTEAPTLPARVARPPSPPSPKKVFLIVKSQKKCVRHRKSILELSAECSSSVCSPLFVKVTAYAQRVILGLTRGCC